MYCSNDVSPCIFNPIQLASPRQFLHMRIPGAGRTEPHTFTLLLHFPTALSAPSSSHLHCLELPRVCYEGNAQSWWVRCFPSIYGPKILNNKR